MRYPLSLHRRAKRTSWDQVLWRTVQMQGPEILRVILKQKGLANDKAGALEPFRPRGWVEKAVVETLGAAGFVSGFALGIQLPQLDFAVSARGKDRDSLVVHSASLMVTRVAIGWVQEVLQRTIQSAKLSANERHYLKALSRVLQQSLKGIEAGWSTRQVAALWLRFRRSKAARQHRVATDARAVALLQQLIERLAL